MLELEGSIYPAIQQWEDAGISLLMGLERYLKLCTSLGRDSLADRAPHTYLAARIDTALGYLHSTLAQQLAFSRSALAQTRNQIIIPLNSLPEEVLSDIFMHVAFAPLDRFYGGDSSSIRDCVIKIHCALRSLLGVCTQWRNAVINRGILWSIVPLFGKLKIPEHYKTIFDHALRQNIGVGLNLIANVCDGIDMSLLANHVARFRAVSIIDTPPHVIQTILAAFTDWRGSDPLKLCQLSLYSSNPYDADRQARDHIIRAVSEQQSFCQLINNLTLLQLGGISLHWEAVAFSERLTTFHLQNIKLGFDSKLAPLLSALSSATQLRELRMIRITTHVSSEPVPDLIKRSRIFLQSLETLVLEGVYFNTLRLLLLSIQSRSHRLSLVLTPIFMKLNFCAPSRQENVSIEIVCELLRQVPIHSLAIDMRWEIEPTLTAMGLKVLLGALPSLKSLRLRIMRLEHDYCLAMERPREPLNSGFPDFVNLGIDYVVLMDPGAFRRMVASHSGIIQRLSLPKPHIRMHGHIDDWELEQDRREEALISWLQNNVPHVTRIGHIFESSSSEYQCLLRERWCIGAETA